MKSQYLRGHEFSKATTSAQPQKSSNSMRPADCLSKEISMKTCHNTLGFAQEVGGHKFCLSFFAISTYPVQSHPTLSNPRSALNDLRPRIPRWALGLTSASSFFSAPAACEVRVSSVGGRSWKNLTKMRGTSWKWGYNMIEWESELSEQLGITNLIRCGCFWESGICTRNKRQFSKKTLIKYLMEGMRQTILKQTREIFRSDR